MNVIDEGVRMTSRLVGNNRENLTRNGNFTKTTAALNITAVIFGSIAMIAGTLNVIIRSAENAASIDKMINNNRPSGNFRNGGGFKKRY